MLSTMPRLIASRARSGGVQWLIGSPLSLGDSHARAMMSVTCSGVNRIGPPGRGWSDNTSRINRSRSCAVAPSRSASARRPSVAAHRSRHRRTRCRSISSRLACSKLVVPSADISTIRDRSDNPRDVFRLAPRRSSTSRCRTDTLTSVALRGKTWPSYSVRSRQPDPPSSGAQPICVLTPAGRV